MNEDVIACQIKRIKKVHAQALLDALSDDANDVEENEMLEENNPNLYSAICTLRLVAGVEW